MLEENEVIKDLEDELKRSKTEGGDWLGRCLQTSAKNRFDATAALQVFLKLCKARNLTHRLHELPKSRLLTLCVWLARLRADMMRKKHKDMSLLLQQYEEFTQPKLMYIPVEAVCCPATPYFIEDARAPFAPPRVTPPRVCPLCGRGFITWKALELHADREHGGVNEWPKTFFWHAEPKCGLSKDLEEGAEPLLALPLSMTRKRNMLSNFDQALRCCRVGGYGELEVREDVACVVCARKEWLEERYWVYLWKTYQADLTLSETSEEDEDEEHHTRI